MKRHALVEASIYLSCFVLIAVGDAIYRYFWKGVALSVAFCQVAVKYGALFLVGAIVAAVIILVEVLSQRLSQRKR